MKKPNIVLFMVDQLAAKWFEAALNGIIEAPQFKRLMDSGTYFANCFTSNPVCCPTRATLATGLTSRGHGLIENGYELDPALPTFMRALQQNGWYTGALGKVHHQPHHASLYPDYKPYGYDVAHTTEDDRGGEWLDWAAKEYPHHFDRVLATVWSYEMPEFASYGPDKVDLQSRIRSIRDTFDWRTEAFPQNTAGSFTLPFPEEISQTAWITGHAVEFIKTAPEGQPFYAHISYVQPHSPFHAPEECMHLVDTSKIPLPQPAGWASDPDAPEYYKKRKPGKTNMHARHCYFADVAYLDIQLGKVYRALEETGQLDNTYILFLSDHGEMLGDQGLSGKEERHYEACLRVPLVISGPGLKKGQRCDKFVQLEDFCPTVLDISGTSLPYMPKQGKALALTSEEIPILPGQSLLPFCKGDPVEWHRNAAYCESYNQLRSNDPKDWARTIRTKEYRYTLYCNHGGDQLFDLTKDPDEQHNVAKSPEYAEIRHQLRDELMEMIILQDYPKTRRSLFALGVH